MVDPDSSLPPWARSWLTRTETGEARIVRDGTTDFKIKVWLERRGGGHWQLFSWISPENDQSTGQNSQSWRLSDPRYSVTRFAVGRGEVWSFRDGDGGESGWWLRQRLPRLGDPDEAPQASRVPGLPSGYWYGGIDVGEHAAAVGMAVGDEVLVFRVPSQGEGHEVRRYPPMSKVMAVSPDGRLAAVSHVGRSTPLRPALDVLDLTSGEVVQELPPSRAVFQRVAQFSPDSTRLVFQEERNNWQALSVLDLRSGEVRRLPIALHRPADLEAVWLPRVERSPLREDLFFSGEFDHLLDHLPDLSLTELGQIDLPPSVLAPDPPEMLLLVARHGMTTSLHRYDLATGACEALSRRTLSYLPYGEGEIAQPTVDTHNGEVTFLSSIDDQLELATVKIFGDADDSTSPIGPVETMIPRVPGGEPEIPIRVHKPRSEPPPGGYPLVVLPHGGPHLQDWEGHNDTVEALTRSGFLVITVNFRGSTGYGADWIEALLENPGFGELDDIAVARAWAISEGLANPNKCAIMGSSWGGYLALLAAGTQPELWQAAVAHAARVDLTADFDLITATMRQVVTHRYGGTPAEKADVYRKCSPITYAEYLGCPVRITVGESDARSFVGPIENFAHRANQAGKDVTVNVVGGGHVIGDVRTRLDVMLGDLAFLTASMSLSERQDRSAEPPRRRRHPAPPTRHPGLGKHRRRRQ